MSVLDRSALEASPLADLHAIASELSIDGYRRLRRPELIDAILAKQEGAEPTQAETAESDQAPPTTRRRRGRREESAVAPEPETAAEDEEAPPTTRRRRGRREESAVAPEPETAAEDEEAPPTTRRRRGRREESAVAPEPETAAEDEDEEAATTARRRRGRRGGRGRGAAGEERADEEQADEEHADEEVAVAKAGEPEHEDDGQLLVEGVVELLANGSGFVRVQPPDPSDDDVYISSAQVKRCELVSGDRVTGPKRTPRRSERFASLIRVDTINGRPASELADSVRFDDLPAEFPSERLVVGPDDPTLKAIDWLTPLGKGSRATIVGEARSGKSHALRKLAEALSRIEGLSVQVVLVGVRPEEIYEWSHGKVVPISALSFAASEDAQNAAVEPVIDQARRLAARGADAVVLIDTLDGCSPQVARRAIASARKIVDGGSLTVIATATAPIGGETTVIALDHELTSVGRFPAIDVFASGTMRAELLVGEDGVRTIATMRIEASEIAAE